MVLDQDLEEPGHHESSSIVSATLRGTRFVLSMGSVVIKITLPTLRLIFCFNVV